MAKRKHTPYIDVEAEDTSTSTHEESEDIDGLSDALPDDYKPRDWNRFTDDLVRKYAPHRERGEHYISGREGTRGEGIRREGTRHHYGDESEEGDDYEDEEDDEVESDYEEVEGGRNVPQHFLVPDQKSPRLWIVRVVRGKEKEVVMKLANYCAKRQQEEAEKIAQEKEKSIENDNLESNNLVNKKERNINLHENNENLINKRDKLQNINITENEEINKKDKERIKNDLQINKCIKTEIEASFPILSVISKPDLHGYIYIESYSKNAVIEALQTSRLITSRKKTSPVPLNEMIDVLTIKAVENIKKDSFAKVKKGKYTNDIAQIVSVINGEMVRVRIVPRLAPFIASRPTLATNERENTGDNKGNLIHLEKPNSTVTYPAKLFNPDDYDSRAVTYKKETNTYIYRKETFVEGFLVKDILVSSLILNAEVSFEETLLFRKKKPFSVNETVKIKKGDLVNIVGKIRSIEQDEAEIEYKNDYFKVPVTDIEKHIVVGEEVSYENKNGLVVYVEGNDVRIVLFDGYEEIRVSRDDVEPPCNKKGFEIVPNLARTRIRKDAYINQWVEIKKGEYKGYMGVVKDVYKDSCRILLDSNHKYVNVDRSDVALDGGVDVRFNIEHEDRFKEKSETPFYTKNQFSSFEGGKTPRYTKEGSFTSMEDGKTPGYKRNEYLGRKAYAGKEGYVGKTPHYSKEDYSGKTPHYDKEAYSSRTPHYTGKTPHYDKEEYSSRTSHYTGKTPNYKNDYSGKTPSYNKEGDYIGKSGFIREDYSGKTPNYNKKEDSIANFNYKKDDYSGKTPSYNKKEDFIGTSNYKKDDYSGKTPSYNKKEDFIGNYNYSGKTPSYNKEGNLGKTPDNFRNMYNGKTPNYQRDSNTSNNQNYGRDLDAGKTPNYFASKHAYKNNMGVDEEFLLKDILIYKDGFERRVKVENKDEFVLEDGSVLKDLHLVPPEVYDNACIVRGEHKGFRGILIEKKDGRGSIRDDSHTVKTVEIDMLAKVYTNELV